MEIKNLNYLYQNKDIKNNFFVDYQNILLAVIYIYLIENVKTGKKYVGKTTNIKNRISQYIRASYIENNNRDITKALYEEGIENFKMRIIDLASNDIEGCDKEKYYIRYYDCVNNGYNKNYESTFCLTNRNTSNYGHKHSIETKIKKSKMVAAVNLKRQEIIFSIGMKCIADCIGTTKDIVSHAFNRCGKIYEYNIIALHPSDIAKQNAKIKNALNSKNINKIIKFKEFQNAQKIVYDTLDTETLFDDFSYIFIIPSENENKFETSDLCDVFKYYKMVSGSSY